jgi:ribonuclease-3
VPDAGGSSERLEFLGDALLGAVVARILFARLPDADEGTLSRTRSHVVRTETLAAAARRLGVEDLLVVGRGERSEGRHTHGPLLADAYEALVGALFLDRGAEAVDRFVHDTLGDVLAAVVAVPPSPDPKTRLQVLLQARGRGLPSYEIVSAEGQGHSQRFVAEVRAGSEVLGRGEGPNKRSATANAAAAALAALDSGKGITGQEA